MTRNQQLKEDLRHIPRGPKGSPQNMFRSCYSMYYSSDSRAKSLAMALALAETKFPGSTLVYDQAYFG